MDEDNDTELYLGCQGSGGLLSTDHTSQKKEVDRRIVEK